MSLKKGDSLVIGPHPYEGGRWSWTGPDDYYYLGREARFKNMDGTKSGIYTGKYVNPSGCETELKVKVVVDDPDHPYVEPPPEDTSTTAVRGVRSMASVRVYRFGDGIRVTGLDGEWAEFRMYDMQGVPVKTARFAGDAIVQMAPSLPRGFYIVQVLDRSGRRLFERILRY